MPGRRVSLEGKGETESSPEIPGLVGRPGPLISSLDPLPVILTLMCSFLIFPLSTAAAPSQDPSA